MHSGELEAQKAKGGERRERGSGRLSSGVMDRGRGALETSEARGNLQGVRGDMAPRSPLRSEGGISL